MIGTCYTVTTDAGDPLHELDQLAHYTRKGVRSRPFIASVLAADAVLRLQTQAATAGPSIFKRAKQDLLAAHALVTRDADLQPIQHTLTTSLRRIIAALAAGTTTVPHALPEAQNALSTAITAAYTVGAQSLYPDYAIPDDDAADLADRVQNEQSYLIAFLAAAAAGGISDAQLNQRLALWAAQTRGAYEQGKGSGAVAEQDDVEEPDDERQGSRHRLIGAAIGGAAALAGSFSDKEPTFIWIAVGDKDTCDYCDEQDGQTFTVGQLDDMGYPGDSAFGDSIQGCAGGVNCRCIIIPTSWLKSARPYILHDSTI